MFEHCIRSSVAIWGIPDRLMDEIWEETARYLAMIPEENILTLHNHKSGTAKSGILPTAGIPIPSHNSGKMQAVKQATITRLYFFLPFLGKL